MNLREKIRDIPDFPKSGIVFKDITPLLSDPPSVSYALAQMEMAVSPYRPIDLVAGIESRGFIFGPLLAGRLGVGFVPIRKKGKLPYKVVRQEYEKEYGLDIIEIHEDAIKLGQRVLLVDDLIATGGTAKAAADLIKKLGGEVVALAFLVELSFLKPREILNDYPIISLISYEN